MNKRLIEKLTYEVMRSENINEILNIFIDVQDRIRKIYTPEFDFISDSIQQSFEDLYEIQQDGFKTIEDLKDKLKKEMK